MNNRLPQSDDVCILALEKNGEKYVWFFEDTQRAEVLRSLGQFASNKELAFSWYDAAVLSGKVRSGAK